MCIPLFASRSVQFFFAFAAVARSDIQSRHHKIVYSSGNEQMAKARKPSRIQRIRRVDRQGIFLEARFWATFGWLTISSATPVRFESFRQH
jgi:hypothetical protein